MWVCGSVGILEDGLVRGRKLGRVLSDVRRKIFRGLRYLNGDRPPIIKTIKLVELTEHQEPKIWNRSML